MFAEVVLAKTARYTDKIFHYCIPATLEGKVTVGVQVLVPFGHRREIGYVASLIEKSDVPDVKEIIAITMPLPLFSEKQVILAKWVAEYYGSFFITALKMMMPPPGGKRTFEHLACRQAGLSIGTFEKSEECSSNIVPVLTKEQEESLREIKIAIDQKKTATFLLYGVTGSGKTEVYMQAVAQVLKLGRGAIVLVPEIALTPQIVERFQARFPEQIAVLHSQVSLKKRRETWGKIARAEIKIVLGTRLAVFAPVKDLGLIVIDEEFEITYKQEKSPRYHAREVAEQLAKLHQAVLIMGSATPSVETYYRAEKGEYKKLVLPERIEKRPLPQVEIVDMREEEGWILSQKLREALKITLEKKEQAILFLNRRGYFTFVMCGKCGFSIGCPVCSVALTYHTADKKLHCNHCGHVTTLPQSCPRCNSVAIKCFGTGTQRIEKEVMTACPEAKILRYDRDSASHKTSHEAFFAAFSKGAADVLIGTQMVAKGLDIAKVTLVGVISADTGLQFPDFRAAEHTFQVLTQVAGRAGRHNLQGKVIIQTYVPEHYAIQAAKEHDYDRFYRQEIQYRQELGYPPFSKLINISIAGTEENKALGVSNELAEQLRQRLGAAVLGPAPAVIAKIRGDWRYQIQLKGEDLTPMRKAVLETLGAVSIPSKVKVAVDVEPMF